MAPSSKSKGKKPKPKKSHQRKQTHQKLIPNSGTNNAAKDKEHRPAKGRTQKRTRVKEIVFDPEARREYLRGFSARKQQRRAYGLAMQQLKDRKARLENRKELKEADLERIEEAERLKEKLVTDAASAKDANAANDDDDDVKKETKKKASTPTDNAANDESKSPNNNEENTGSNKSPKKTTTTYHDESIQQLWGGDVVVTTSLGVPDDSDSDEEDDNSKPKSKKRTKLHKSRDEQQEFAGNVEKYLLKLKSNMPNKKNKTTQHRGGKHGAAGMKGIGNAKEMKIAQKALARSSSKAPAGGKSSGKKRRGGKR